MSRLYREEDMFSSPHHWIQIGYIRSKCSFVCVFLISFKMCVVIGRMVEEAGAEDRVYMYLYLLCVGNFTSFIHFVYAYCYWPFWETRKEVFQFNEKQNTIQILLSLWRSVIIKFMRSHCSICTVLHFILSDDLHSFLSEISRLHPNSVRARIVDKSQTDILSQVRGCHLGICDWRQKISVTKYHCRFLLYVIT